MLIDRRSASNSSSSHMTSAVVPPSDWQKAWKSSRYALKSDDRMISMLRSSRSPTFSSAAWKYLPSPVSTRTKSYSSAADAATVIAPMDSKRPIGWHFSMRSLVVRPAWVPKMRKAMLSI
eukprot:Amastigsp_a676981_1451.p3 type:complete len:120 gc:universal Amastigsp_a676981_1451:390-749(+)